MTDAIDAARERMASVLFAKWGQRDLQDLARLMRRFADDLQSLPMPEQDRDARRDDLRGRIKPGQVHDA
jgi:hypothetical protein